MGLDTWVLYMVSFYKATGPKILVKTIGRVLRNFLRGLECVDKWLLVYGFGLMGKFCTCSYPRGIHGAIIWYLVGLCIDFQRGRTEER